MKFKMPYPDTYGIAAQIAIVCRRIPKDYTDDKSTLES